MRSPATGWQVFIFNVILMLGLLMSMCNVILQHCVEGFYSTLQTPVRTAVPFPDEVVVDSWV